MLSRTADSVYWMSRYTERAENVARLLDVTYRMSLLPTTGVSGYWGAALSANGLDEAYQKKIRGVFGCQCGALHGAGRRQSVVDTYLLAQRA